MKRLLWIIPVVALGFGLAAIPADARNYPCSKGKGGVSHCKNGKFICKDGSVSQSKRTCRRQTPRAARPMRASGKPRATG